MDFPRAVIRIPFGLFKLFRHSFKLAFPDGGKISSFRPTGRRFIKENRKSVLFGCCFCHCFGNLDCFLHGCVTNRNERNDIHCAHSRVLPIMFSHVDDIDGGTHGIDHCRFQCIRFSDNRNHQPVMIFIPLIIEEFDIRPLPKWPHNLLDFI